MSKKILIIDDDLIFLESLEELLMLENYIVLPLAQAVGIDEAIISFKPDIIILDIRLDDGDGRLICNELKRNFSTQHIPVIIVTGLEYGDISDVECSAAAVLGKPYNVPNLLMTIADLLN